MVAHRIGEQNHSTDKILLKAMNHDSLFAVA